MHNFGTVLKFELTRTLKKPTFWLSILAIPALIGVVVAVVYFSNVSTSDREEEVRNTPFSLIIDDQTGIIEDSTVRALKAERTTDKQAAIEKVRTGKIDAFFYYPHDVAGQPIEIYNKNDGVMDNSKYSDIATTLLKTSATAAVASPDIIAILNGTVKTEQKNYEDGKEANILGKIIPPMLFLIAFYSVIVLFGNQMLTSTTEEKENRVTEMLLTSISSRSLIVGKIISLLILGFIQIAVMAVPTVLAYIYGREALNIPDLSGLLNNLQFEFWPIFLGALVLIFGFLLFTGLLVAIGAAMPTAKEANSFFGFVIVLMIVPFWFFPMLMSSTNSVVVTGLTYFPLTAPFTLLIRNGFGTLTLTESIIGLIVVVVSGFVAISAAVRIFRYGTLEYSKRISLSSVFGKSK